MTYLITFTCYGCHIHGEEEGSVDRKRHLYKSPLVAPNQRRLSAEKRQMDQAPYALDHARRGAVLSALVERCSTQQWTLLAAHVRTSHVHVVVEAEVRPERIMNDLKSCASRCLNRLGLDNPARKRWARHGSTRWLWHVDNVSAAIQYVLEEQGEPMASYRPEVH